MPTPRWRLALAAAWLATAPAWGQVPDWSLAARQRLFNPPGATPDALQAARRQALDDGERLLAGGDTAAAQDAFDRAAGLLHAPDTEASLVRTHLQAGDYRRALAFGAHAAGAHRREWPAGMALYAWLLQAGGQGVVARRQLDEALALAPGDATLLQARAQLSAAWPRADGLLLERPLRLAPYASGAAVPGTARAVGNAVLVRGGTAALVPSAVLPIRSWPTASLPTALLPAGQPMDAAPGTETLWLRNGLGQTVAAVPQARDDALGLVLLRLLAPLPGAGVPMAARAPFGGSPGYRVDYPPDEPVPAWPLLRAGFFARLALAPGPRRLGIDAPPGPRGGPVYDADGRIAGIAVAGADGADQLVPAAALAQRFGDDLWAVRPPPDPATTTATASRRADVDAVYEQALHQALQVLAVR